MLHFGQILAALSAGKEVVCEKPLVGSLAEIDRVIAAEKEAVGRVMPIFQYRFGNGVQKARRIIELGIAGKPYLGTVETAWKRTAKYYETRWRGRRETERGELCASSSAIWPWWFGWCRWRTSRVSRDRSRAAGRSSATPQGRVRQSLAASLPASILQDWLGECRARRGIRPADR
jgi:hypothetical protein